MTLSKTGPVVRSDKGEAEHLVCWRRRQSTRLSRQASKRLHGSAKWFQMVWFGKIPEGAGVSYHTNKNAQSAAQTGFDTQRSRSTSGWRATAVCFTHIVLLSTWISDTGWVLQNSAWSRRLRPNASCALSVQMSVKDCSFPKLAFSP